MKKRNFWVQIIGTVVITIILTSIVIFFGLPRITAITSSWGVAEAAIVISICSLIVQLSPPFIDNYLSKKQNRLNETFYAISLDISVLGDGNVAFAATIENVGIETIHPQYTKLYIDQGMNSNTEVYEYGFPFVLEHKNNNDGTEDCILCRRCKNEDGSNYPIDMVPDSFKREMTSGKLFTGCFDLRHLSERSIKYIRGHERFQEEIIIRFSNPGVYRATLVVITKDADCQCATKQFYIKV